MNKLLPKTVGEFSDEAYWKKFFAEYAEHNKDSFEWYGDYSDVKLSLERYLKVSDSILQIGCGNSLVADHLYDSGYRQVTSVDIVADAIKKQRQRNKKRRPELIFEVTDVTSPLAYEASTFNVVLDKGTLDALLCDESAENMNKVSFMFDEIYRCLCVNGRYIVVSLAQDLIIKHWCNKFTGKCLLRVIQVANKGSEKRVVFLLIATKLKEGLKFNEVYEYMNSRDVTPRRFSKVDDLLDAVHAAQQYSYFCFKASQHFFPTELNIQLSDEKTSLPAYDIVLVHRQDKPKTGLPFGVFVIPYGSENHYFYATPAGRQELCNLSDFRRLAVVTVKRSGGGREKTFDDIKAELNTIILDFAPAYLRDAQSRSDIPYLSVGPDHKNTSTVVKESYQSEISGTFDVCDLTQCEASGNSRHPTKILRQLIFRSNTSLVQSEVRMLDQPNECLTLDWSSLACLHHRAIVAAVAISCQDFANAPLNVCLVGLGGGCLATFLHKHFPLISITVVELDPVIVKAAEAWFDFKQDEKLTCIIGDGVEFLNKKARQVQQTEQCGGDHSPLYDVIILDVSGSETFEGGLTCPPPTFLMDECANDIKTLLKPKGALALNLMVRCKDAAATIKQRFEQIFATVLSHSITDDLVNELLICLPYKPDDPPAFNNWVQGQLTALHDHLAALCEAGSSVLHSDGQPSGLKKSSADALNDCTVLTGEDNNCVMDGHDESPAKSERVVQDIIDKIVKI